MCHLFVYVTYFLLQFFYIFTQFDSVLGDIGTSKNAQNIDTNRRKLFCCLRKLRCCEEESIPAAFEVKTVPNKCLSSILQKTNAINENESCNSVNADNKKCPSNMLENIVEHLKMGKLGKCDSALHVTIKISTRDFTTDHSQYVVIDHVFDYNRTPAKRIFLQNPFVLKIQQELVQQYDLRFESVVNGQVNEVVDSGECNSSNERKCRQMVYEGRAIPYSEGFSCSCGRFSGPPANKRIVQNENGKMSAVGRSRLSMPLKMFYTNHYAVAPNLHYQKHAISRPNRMGLYGHKIFKSTGSIPQNILHIPYRHRLGRNENCPEACPQNQHCLNFSKNWYNSYTIKNPTIRHRLELQVYQKFTDSKCGTVWNNLTQSKSLVVGTDYNSDSIPNSIQVKYHSANCNPTFCLDPDHQKLLVPEGGDCKPEEFLVMPKQLVAVDGKSCNTAGVGYQAFYKQRKRCDQPIGTCLDNQPEQLHQQDLAADKDQKPGEHLLKNFGILAANPVVRNASNQIQGVKLLYAGPFTSTLDFEIQVDNTIMVQIGKWATITEVYVVSSASQGTTIITVKITNSGLISAMFCLKFEKCSQGLPLTFNGLDSQLVEIPPQMQHVFELKVDCSLPPGEHSCNLNVLNGEQEVVARRLVDFRTDDKCICIWYCSCQCLGLCDKLKCIPIALNDYHAAGFQGGLPIPTIIVQSTYYDNLLTILFYSLVLIMILGMLLGLIKALIGFTISKRIGRWGHDTIFGYTNRMKTNKRSTTSNTIPSCSSDRSMNDVSKGALFCVNVLFFCIFPLAWFNQKLFRPKAKKERREVQRFSPRKGLPKANRYICVDSKSSSNTTKKRTFMGMESLRKLAGKAIPKKKVLKNQKGSAPDICACDSSNKSK